MKQQEINVTLENYDDVVSKLKRKSINYLYMKKNFLNGQLVN